MSKRAHQTLLNAVGSLCTALALLLWSGAAVHAQAAAPAPAKAGPTTSRPALLDPATPAVAKVLLVDDDDSDNNSNPASSALSASDSFYRGMLKAQSLAFDTVVVPRYADGPTAEKLKGYSLIVWYTGAAYGGNRDNTAVISLKDEVTLRSYLADTGGTVLLFSPGYLNNALGAGGTALWAKKESPFLQQVLGIKGGRGLLQRFKEGTVNAANGTSYVVAKSPTVEIQFSAANPDTATTLYTATLDPDGKGPQSVAVATRQAVGAGHFVYVGFTFENIAIGAGAAFAQILSAAGVSGGAAPSAVAAAGAPFSPRHARTQKLTVTGSGLLTAGPAFVPRRARTGSLLVSGTGNLADGPPFVPRRARTAGLTVTGTGSLQ